MELYHQILASYFSMSDDFSKQIDAPKIVEGQCYQAICQIYEILNDDHLSDPECFAKIEQIVAIMEKLGPGAGCRHDFG